MPSSKHFTTDRLKYMAKVRYSMGVTSWQGVYGTTAARKRWPPHETFPRDRDASIWFNSSFTEPHHLMSALSFFMTSGWPVEALDDFLGAIEPEIGWQDPNAVKHRKDWTNKQWRRSADQYGEAWAALRHGYWEPKK